ncbi:MAG: hypothetical protein Q9171_003247 [Xanthocarpia ochracea]
MPRKRKPPKQPKRLKHTDADGWTHITRGLKNMNLNKNSPLPTQPLQPPEIPQNQTLSDLEKFHARYRDQWLSSSCYHTIRNIFLHEVIPDFTNAKKRREIDQCIILGLGSLSNGRRSSWWELVFLESVLTLLLDSPASPSSIATANPQANNNNDRSPINAAEATSSSGITVYIQDPIFNPLDITFLSSSLKYTLLTHPSAFSKITSSTLLFAPHLEIEVYAQTLAGVEQKQQPQICIGTDLTQCIDRLNTHGARKDDDDDDDDDDDEERRKRQRIFQEYADTTVSKRLPEFEKDDWMYFTSVYWKNMNRHTSD